MNNREAMQKAFETCERYAGRDFAKTNGVYADDGVQHEFGHFLEGYQAALASQQDHIPDVGKMVQSQAQQPTPDHLEVAKVALQKLACLGNGDTYGNSIGNQIAIDALMALTIPPAAQAQQESKPVAWGYAWQCKSVGDWRIEKLGEGCIPPKDTLALYTLPPAPEVCSDGGKCGAGGYCITCPNMPAPEGGDK